VVGLRLADLPLGAAQRVILAGLQLGAKSFDWTAPLPQHRASQGYSYSVRDLAISEDGSACVVLLEETRWPDDLARRVFRIDPATGREPVEVEVADLVLESPIRISPDGRVVAGVQGSAVVLFGEGPPRTCQAPDDPGPVRALAFSPDGRTLASAGKSGRVTLWGLSEPRPIMTYDWDIKDIQSLAFAPDGLRLAAGGDWGQIVVWDLE
jgi:WD40 repeat protein